MPDPMQATAANAALDILEALVERGAVGEISRLPGSLRALMVEMDEAGREDPVVAEATGNMLRLMIGRGSVKSMDEVPASAKRLRHALSGVVDNLMGDPTPATVEHKVKAAAPSPREAQAEPQQAAASAGPVESETEAEPKLFGAAARAAEARKQRADEAAQKGIALKEHQPRSHKRKKEDNNLAPGEPTPERLAENKFLRRPSESGQKPAVDPRKSITEDVIICLEDGKELTMLKRYIQTRFQMTPEEYRWKWGLPPDYPMTAPNYSLQKSVYAKGQGLGQGNLRPGMKAKKVETANA